MIEIITTGGTFDKIYFPTEGVLRFDAEKNSIINTFIKKANLTIDITQQALPPIDSLNMKDDYREMILNACINSPRQAIIITHGTDTMPETARYLNRRNLDKRIVLTGAMIPASIKGSDAFFNFGFAVAAVQTCPVGVFIAMNGQLLPAETAYKNKSKGVFTHT